MSDRNVTLEEAAKRIVSSREFSRNQDIAVLLKALSSDKGARPDSVTGADLAFVDPWGRGAGEPEYWRGEPSQKAISAMLDLEGMRLLTHTTSINSDEGADQSVRLTELGLSVAKLIDPKMPARIVDRTAFRMIGEVRENVNDEGAQVVRWKRG